MQFGERSPDRRVVMLGASNVVRGLPTVVETACQTWGRPLDLLVAAGHGRSYGRHSSVLGRGLPGILQCGLWDQMAKSPHAPTAALLTDVGNDILYQVPVGRITDWIKTCLERLRPRAERIIVTELPLHSLGRLGSARYLVARSLLFPRSRLELGDAIRRAEQLNGALIHLAEQYQADLVKPESHWYGVDPIHIRRRIEPTAWQHLLSPWQQADELRPVERSWLRWWRLVRMRPLERSLFGIRQCRSQPAGTLADGSLVSLF